MLLESIPPPRAVHALIFAHMQVSSEVNNSGWLTSEEHYACEKLCMHDGGVHWSPLPDDVDPGGVPHKRDRVLPVI